MSGSPRRLRRPGRARSTSWTRRSASTWPGSASELLERQGPVIMTETRHSHGGVQHDHEGGEIPHGHSDPPSREPEHRPGNGASAAFGFGTVLAVFGGLGMLWQSNNHPPPPAGGRQ